MPSPLKFDPIAEAQRQWQLRWDRDDEMAAATSIVRVQQIILAEVDTALKPFDLNFARYEALVLLLFSKKGSLPLGKMGPRLMVHPTSVTNIIDRLEAQGFVLRVPHPTDGRTTLAELTEEGRRVTVQATKAVTNSAFGLSVLTAKELKDLTAILRKLRLATKDYIES
jgi:DNA-binding MarR family transcriptional regulator